MFVEVIDVIISGLLTASVYALMAVGLTLVYGVTKVFNFAYGSLYNLGGYIAWVLLTVVGVFGGYLTVFILAIPMLLVVGYLLEKTLVAPLRKRSDWEVKVMMMTLGLSILIDALYVAAFGGRMKSLPPIVDGYSEIYGVILSNQDIVVFVVSVVGILLLAWFLNNTRMGLAVQAVAQNPVGSQIVGIPKDRVFAATFAISTVMVGIGGILLSQKYFVNPAEGSNIMIKAWVITAFGGMGSIRGSLYAALIVGMLEAFVGWTIGLSYTMIVLFIVLIATLVVRPQGLMGKGA
ncbi:MAG: branched-chain amino acid ABC transporter permease [Proteobacteria bacterium]|nr:branched-chain amino acid ABC transporter permease [Pseudomonadota bacterium]